MWVSSTAQEPCNDLQQSTAVGCASIPSHWKRESDEGGRGLGGREDPVSDDVVHMRIRFRTVEVKRLLVP